MENSDAVHRDPHAPATAPGGQPPPDASPDEPPPDASPEEQLPTARGEPPPPDVADLLEQLRARVEERRRAGAYPPGLEHDLDVHFRHIVEHRPVRDLDSLHKAMAAFEERLTFDTAQIPTGSRTPGGELLHRAVSKVMVRQTGWLAQQLQDFAEAVRSILWKMVETLDTPNHIHSELTAQMDIVLDRLAYYERAPADAAMLGSILMRLEALEAKSAGHTGPTGHRSVAARLAGHSPVLTIEAGAVEALGATGKGLLGGLGLTGDVSGFSPDQLSALAVLAFERLHPGGLMVADLQTAAQPADLVDCLRTAGFADVTVEGQPIEAQPAQGQPVGVEPQPSHPRRCMIIATR